MYPELMTTEFEVSWDMILCLSMNYTCRDFRDAENKESGVPAVAQQFTIHDVAY